MKTLTIRCSKSDSELTLSEISFETKDGTFFSYQAALSNSHLKAQVEVADASHRGWVDFFADLAENWRGWKGEKKTATLEGHLSIKCTVDPLGHVTLRVRLQDVSNSWHAEQDLQLESGQLEELSKQNKTFFTP